MILPKKDDFKKNCEIRLTFVLHIFFVQELKSSKNRFSTFNTTKTYIYKILNTTH